MKERIQKEVLLVVPSAVGFVFGIFPGIAAGIVVFLVLRVNPVVQLP
jgi:hypothetical protein